MEEETRTEEKTEETSPTKKSELSYKEKSESYERDYISEARTENARREKILEEEKKLQERKEKLHAEQMSTGRGQLIPKTEIKPLTDREYWDMIKKGEMPPKQ